MNPTANKSDFDDLTTNLKDLAYSYLEKYNPSKQQLKVFLLKKYLTKIKKDKRGIINKNKKNGLLIISERLIRYLVKKGSSLFKEENCETTSGTT